MEILGIGFGEIVLILIIALIVLGPNDMVKTGRSLGRWMRRIVLSPSWQAIQKTSRDIRYLPNKLIREAGLEEDLKELNELQRQVPRTLDLGKELGMDEIDRDLKAAQSDISSWTTPQTIQPPPGPAEPAKANPDPEPEPELEPERNTGPDQEPGSAQANSQD